MFLFFLLYSRKRAFFEEKILYTKAVSLGLDPNQVVAKITNNGYVPDRGISWDIKVTDPYAHYAHIRATQHLQHTTIEERRCWIGS